MKAVITSLFVITVLPLILIVVLFKVISIKADEFIRTFL